MGLGKTLQSITVMSILRFDQKIRPPFRMFLLINLLIKHFFSKLIIIILDIAVVLAPLSVIDNWASELKMFSPKLKVLKYIGNMEEREQMRKEIVHFILAQPKHAHVRFHAGLYALPLNYFFNFKKICWK